MILNEIREYIAAGIINSKEWINVLNKTNPGHFGLVEGHVSISKDHVSVDLPCRRFMIKDVQYAFILQLRSPSEEEGVKKWFTRIATGMGVFRLDQETEKITIESLSIDFDLDLYCREEHVI